MVVGAALRQLEAALDAVGFIFQARAGTPGQVREVGRHSQPFAATEHTRAGRFQAGHQALGDAVTEASEAFAARCFPAGHTRRIRGPSSSARRGSPRWLGSRDRSCRFGQWAEPAQLVAQHLRTSWFEGATKRGVFAGAGSHRSSGTDVAPRLTHHHHQPLGWAGNTVTSFAILKTRAPRGREWGLSGWLQGPRKRDDHRAPHWRLGASSLSARRGIHPIGRRCHGTCTVAIEWDTLVALRRAGPLVEAEHLANGALTRRSRSHHQHA